MVYFHFYLSLGLDMITIHNYHIHHKKDYLIAVNHETPVCPDCGSGLIVKDSYKRKTKDSSGKEYAFRLRRLFCDHCKKLHSEIPDCITAFKTYDTKTIEEVTNGLIQFYTCDSSTAYRWRNTYDLQ